MASNLRALTRQFSLGAVTFGTWREAARTEAVDRRLADEILRLIGEWENTEWPDIARAREGLRARVDQLVPPASADAPEPKRKVDPTTAMYEAGLRGQRRGL